MVLTLTPTISANYLFSSAPSRTQPTRTVLEPLSPAYNTALARLRSMSSELAASLLGHITNDGQHNRIRQRHIHHSAVAQTNDRRQRGSQQE